MKKAYLFGLALLISASGIAQEAVLSSGNDLSGAGGSVSYSIGQVVYTTNSGTNGSVAQGVQQAYEVSVTFVADPEVSVSVNIYPNPAHDYLVLESDQPDNEGLSYQLHSINSGLIDGQVFGKETQVVDMRSLPRAIYLLTINKDNIPIKTFKIIKN